MMFYQTPSSLYASYNTGVVWSMNIIFGINSNVRWIICSQVGMEDYGLISSFI